MKYSAEALSLAGDKYLGRSYGEMDCQKFVEQCMADVGCRRDLPGSNAWYRAMDWTGTPEECLRQFGTVPKGAVLFIVESDGREPAKYRGDGKGNASHMGLKTGRGDGAIHSSQSRGCVCESKFSDRTVPNGGWNRVGLLAAFDYGTGVTWVLEHGISDPKTEGGSSMETKEGTVYAENGKPVNLRKAASTDAALVDRIPSGTPAEILAENGAWCRIRANGRTGWMMKQFLSTDGDLPAADESGIPAEDFGGADEADPGDAAALLAKVYTALGELREEIGKGIGRG